MSLGTQGGTQDGTKEDNLDKLIENQIRQNPRITTEELAKMSKKGMRTIKRHIANMPHIHYVGSGYIVAIGKLLRKNNYRHNRHLLF